MFSGKPQIGRPIWIRSPGNTLGSNFGAVLLHLLEVRPRGANRTPDAAECFGRNNLYAVTFPPAKIKSSGLLAFLPTWHAKHGFALVVEWMDIHSFFGERAQTVSCTVVHRSALHIADSGILLVLSRECRNEPGDSLKGNQLWMVYPGHSLIPCALLALVAAPWAFARHFFEDCLAAGLGSRAPRVCLPLLVLPLPLWFFQNSPSTSKHLQTPPYTSIHLHTPPYTLHTPPYTSIHLHTPSIHLHTPPDSKPEDDLLLARLAAHAFALGPLTTTILPGQGTLRTWPVISTLELGRLSRVPQPASAHFHPPIDSLAVRLAWAMVICRKSGCALEVPWEPFWPFFLPKVKINLLAFR